MIKAYALGLAGQAISGLAFVISMISVLGWIAGWWDVPTAGISVAIGLLVVAVIDMVAMWWLYRRDRAKEDQDER